jgi:hypothetical protein
VTSRYRVYDNVYTGAFVSPHAAFVSLHMELN